MITPTTPEFSPVAEFLVDTAHAAEHVGRTALHGVPVVPAALGPKHYEIINTVRLAAEIPPIHLGQLEAMRIITQPRSVTY